MSLLQWQQTDKNQFAVFIRDLTKHLTNVKHMVEDMMKEAPVIKHPKKGKKNILMISPGFSSDCVETLEELNIQGRESFMKNGGINFDYIPCLNDNEDHINLFDKLIKDYLIFK